MFSDAIEQLKSQYTDKYVAVDATRPELARFRDIVGQVKTVNMSGRALVEFLDYHLNIGWYDIDTSFLKIVDKPAPQEKKVEARKPAEKPAAKAAPAAAAAKAPAKPAGAKMSVAEMMAAARANKPAGGDAAAPAKPAAASPASAGAGSAAPAKVDRSKMSVADMLAAARGEKAGGDAPAAKEEASAAPAAPAAPPAEEKPAAPAPKADAGEPQKIDKSKMSVAEMIAYAKKADKQ